MIAEATPDLPMYYSNPNNLRGLWSIMPQHMPSSISTQVSRESGGLQKHENIAFVELRGPLSKDGVFSEVGSTRMFRRQLRQAADDRSVEGVIVLIESPGGHVAGTAEAAADLADLDAIKPVMAFVEDLGGSAAFWIASQATAIHATDSAWVGSIGTFMMLHDFSGMFNDLKIKAIPITTGKFKGAGTMGTEVTAEQIEMFQGLVDQTNEFFIDAVARGRRMHESRVRQVADGRVFLAAEAVELGLIDRVSSLTDSIEAFRSSLTSARSIFAMSSNGQGILAQPVSTQQPVNEPLPQLGENELRRALNIANAMSPLVANSQGQQPQQATQPAPTQQNPGAAASTPVADPQPQASAAPPNAPPAAPAGVSQTPATLEQIKSACPGVGNDFVVAMLERQATVDQAREAYAQALLQENQQLRQQASQPQEPAANSMQNLPAPTDNSGFARSAWTQTAPQPQPQQFVPQPYPGAQGFTGSDQAHNGPILPDPDDGSSGGASASDQWYAAVRKEKQILVDKGMHPAAAQPKAVSAADRKNPGLREMHLAECDYKRMHGIPVGPPQV